MISRLFHICYQPFWNVLIWVSSFNYSSISVNYFSFFCHVKIYGIIFPNFKPKMVVLPVWLSSRKIVAIYNIFSIIIFLLQFFFLSTTGLFLKVKQVQIFQSKSGQAPYRKFSFLSTTKSHKVFRLTEQGWKWKIN